MPTHRSKTKSATAASVLAGRTKPTVQNVPRAAAIDRRRTDGHKRKDGRGLLGGGEATIGYEGAEHVIKAGENFKFAKNGRHWVKANGRFKMALLLVID